MGKDLIIITGSGSLLGETCYCAFPLWLPSQRINGGRGCCKLDNATVCSTVKTNSSFQLFREYCRLKGVKITETNKQFRNF
jgi:hypothetical protein